MKKRKAAQIRKCIGRLPKIICRKSHYRIGKKATTLELCSLSVLSFCLQVPISRAKFVIRRVQMNFVALVLLGFFAHFSLAETWQPTPGYVQTPLWPSAVPDGQVTPGAEETMTKADNLVAGFQLACPMLAPAGAPLCCACNSAFVAEL